MLGLPEHVVCLYLNLVAPAVSLVSFDLASLSRAQDSMIAAITLEVFPGLVDANTVSSCCNSPRMGPMSHCLVSSDRALNMFA